MATPTLVVPATTATSSSTSYTCAKPTGVTSGHVLVALQWSAGTIGAVPAGWASLQSQSSGATSRIAWLAAGGSEPGSYTFTQTAAAGGAIIIAAAGASLTEPVSATSSTAVGAAVSTPSLTPAGIDDLEIRFAIAKEAGGDFEPPSGFTERADVDAGFTIAGTCATRVLASGSATGTHLFTTLGDAATAPHGYTVALTGLSPSSPRVVVATFTAVHRAANW